MWIIFQNSCYFEEIIRKKRSLTSQGDRTEECTKSDLRVKGYLVCDTAFQSNGGRMEPFHPRNSVHPEMFPLYLFPHL